jgi:hypothetical protein
LWAVDLSPALVNLLETDAVGIFFQVTVLLRKEPAENFSIHLHAVVLYRIAELTFVWY